MPALWSLIAIASGRQYGGNEGYEDDPSSYYRYDSRVPNHKQLAEGDVVFVRNATVVLGAARVESIIAKPSTKLERRCPSCSSVNVRERALRHPPWRCSKCAAEFAKPIENKVDVIAFTARYGTSFRSAPPGLQAALLKAAAISPNDQLAIERLDASLLRASIGSLFPEADQLFLSIALGFTLSPMDASPSSAEVAKQPAYVPWEGDKRESVLRAIRLRRGQQSFRSHLIKAHKGRCAVSECGLLDLLEAAHIAPYKGAQDHHVENGLLLRADLHTLFDLGLMAIDPAAMRVWFSASAQKAGYDHLNGKALDFGDAVPSSAALQTRWSAFTLTHGQTETKPQILAPA